jgi:alkanesulfonate monooxygenase SsuD/methylene tetrahydromethanopterin reductase-like flavin-dependent oxidoreductase (luciferase family)
MKFGLLLPAGTHSIEQTRAADARGFASVFYADSPVLFGDPYVTMAAAAVQTSRIVLGVGVTNPLTRSAPVTATCIASLNALAPRRIALGLGVGFTANFAMGTRNATLRELERYVRDVRSLLCGDVADVELLGQDVPVQFLNRGLPFLNVDDPVPLYMAVMGPRGLALAGRLADAVIVGGITEPALIDRCRELIDEGARSAGRSVRDLEICVTPSAYVADREPGFEELREALGPKSLAPAKIYSRMAEATPGIGRELADEMARVREAAYSGPGESGGDPRRRHLTVYRGYLTSLQPWQQPLITPRVLRATSIAGTVEQCAETVRTLEKHGVSHVILAPRPQDQAAVVERFGRDIIPRFA